MKDERDDKDLWKLYASGVKKLRTVKPAAKPKATARKQKIPVTLRGQALTPVDMPPFTGAKPLVLPNLERRTERNLRQGDLTVEARLDLHGKTQTEAYEALARFMAAQVKAGRGTLLIITGKGSAQKGAVAVARSAEQSNANRGVLKTSLPNWLQTLPDAGQILALRTAAPKHGGEGAFYVLLKKKK